MRMTSINKLGLSLAVSSTRAPWAPLDSARTLALSTKNGRSLRSSFCSACTARCIAAASSGSPTLKPATFKASDSRSIKSVIPATTISRRMGRGSTTITRSTWPVFGSNSGTTNAWLKRPVA